MDRLKTILITLATIVATTSATRADELSDLVAAVAGTVQQQMNNDVATAFFDNGKPRYKPRKRQPDLDATMLDGIFSSMKRESFRKMRREIYDDANTSATLQDYYIYPTLGSPGFFRPVPGAITSKFGWRPQFQRVHHGIDLSLNIGDTVRAALSGTIEKISYDHDGYGHYIVMSHPDGMETLYGHLQYALVAQGQFIYAGQPVGIGGNTGNSTGPHLHFEARISGSAIDPTILFDFNQYILYEDKPAITDNREPTYSHQSKSISGQTTYIVRFGDTLKSIAKQAGISVMRLCQLNMLQESQSPEVGRMLKLQ